MTREMEVIEWILEGDDRESCAATFFVSVVPDDFGRLSAEIKSGVEHSADGDIPCVKRLRMKTREQIEQYARDQYRKALLEREFTDEGPPRGAA